MVVFLASYATRPSLQVGDADAFSLVTYAVVAGVGNNTLHHPSGYTIAFAFSTSNQSTPPAAKLTSSGISVIADAVSTTSKGNDTNGGYGATSAGFGGAYGTVSAPNPKMRFDSENGNLTVAEGTLKIKQDVANDATLTIFFGKVRSVSASEELLTTDSDVAVAADDVRTDSSTDIETTFGNPSTAGANSAEFVIKALFKVGATARVTGQTARSVTYTGSVVEAS